jgi:hypothetical protein
MHPGNTTYFEAQGIFLGNETLIHAVADVLDLSCGNPTTEQRAELRAVVVNSAPDQLEARAQFVTRNAWSICVSSTTMTRTILISRSRASGGGHP